MGLLDWLFGRQGAVGDRRDYRGPPRDYDYDRTGPAAPEELSDEEAIERYHYMLRTAPPDAIEQAHEEAFARLTPEQRAQVLQQLSEITPAHERQSANGRPDDPRNLARMATRAEIRDPGSVERALSRSGPGYAGPSFFSMFAASFLGSMVFSSLFGGFGGFGGEASAAESEGGDAGAGEDWSGAEGYSEGGRWDEIGSGGEDYGAGGGDFSGGDFGGGDFGGDIGGFDGGGFDFGGDFG